MAHVNQGDDLADYILQPGWTVNIDSYGLATASCVFKVNDTVDKATPLIVGEALPDSAFSYMKAHKSSSKYDRSGIATVTIDYVGIVDRETTQTIPQLFAASSLASEPLTSHENFFTAVSGYSAVIAGSSYTQDTTGDTAIGPPVKHIIPASGATPARTEPVPCWLGEHGSAFERESGGRFIGFVDPASPAFYGKTNYLTPTATLNGIVYTESETDVQTFNTMIGVATKSHDWNGALPNIIPDYMGTTFLSADNFPQMLLSQASVEVFSGAIYKVSFEIKFSRVGWHTAVYRYADA